MAGFIPAIHVLRATQQTRRGWPGQARPWRKQTHRQARSRLTRASLPYSCAVEPRS